MKTYICALLVAGGLAGCGSATTVTVTTGAGPTPVVHAADPSLDAQCVAEPNLPPRCTQGDYQVSITIGQACVDPQYQQPESWQWTYTGSSTARCMTNPR